MSEDRTGSYERRLTVSQAADQLGVSTEAIRGRIRRDTIRHERVGGRVYVVLDDRPTGEHTTDQPTGHTEELIRTLREQLELERQAHAEARRIIAGLVERMPPQLEAPTDAPGSSDTATDEGDWGNLPREPHPHAEATDTGEGVVSDRERSTPRGLTSRQQTLLGLGAPVVAAFISALATIIAAAGDSLSGIISSIWTAFSTAISLGLSAITGDQLVQIVGTVVTVLGTIAATYLGIRWSRRGRNQ